MAAANPGVPRSAVELRELPPGGKALRKILPADTGLFGDADERRRLGAVDRQQPGVPLPADEPAVLPYLDITHERAVATLQAMRRIVASGNPDWNAEVRQKFEVYRSVGPVAGRRRVRGGSLGGYSAQVLFTG